jgi:hypothetical protein
MQQLLKYKSQVIFTILAYAYVLISISSTMISPFPIHEEFYDLDSRHSFKALLSGSFMHNLEQSNATVFSSIPWVVLDYMNIDLIGLDVIQSHKIKILVRVIIIFTLLIILMSKFTSNYFIALLLSGFAIFNFNYFNSMLFSSKYSIYTLFVGGLLSILLIEYNKKLSYLLYVSILILSFPIISNLSNLAAALSFIFIHALICAFTNKARVKQVTPFILMTVILYFPFIYLNYFTTSRFQYFIDVGRNQKVEIVGSSFLNSIVGSGYWAEFFAFQDLNIFFWTPSNDILFQARQFLILLLFMFLIGVTLSQMNERRNSELNGLYKKIVIFLFFSLFFISLSIIDINNEFYRNLIKLIPILSAFREPWVRFIPIFLITATIFIALSLEYIVIRFGKQTKARSILISLPITLIIINIIVFNISSQSSIQYWKKTSDKYVFDPSIWTLYYKSDFVRLQNDFEIINKISEKESKSDRKVCLEVNLGSGSFRRDLIALGRLEFKGPVLANWHQFGKSEGSNKSWVTWSCSIRSAIDESVSYTFVPNFNKFNFTEGLNRNFRETKIKSEIKNCSVSSPLIHFYTIDSLCMRNTRIVLDSWFE